MTDHNPVPVDVAKHIVELSEEGYGVNQIGFITGVNSSTVRRIIQGEHQSFCNKLSARQIQRFLDNCFPRYSNGR